MGEKDIVTKDYLAVPERFAQIYNNGCFDGKPLIKPEKLRELNAGEIAFLGRHGIRQNGIEKQRDILKVYDNRMFLMIFGIENQTDVHFCMPLRQMLYDAMRYEEQRREIARKHEKEKDLDGAELISRFSKTDRFIPVMTLVVCWSVDVWDGPKSLHEMLDFPPEMLQYKDMIADYRINLLEVSRIENLDVYSPELKALFGFVKYQKDKKALFQFVEKNEDIFQKLDNETAEVMTVFGKAPEFRKYLEKTKKKGKEGVDMNQALQDLIRDSKLEAKRQSAANLRKRGYDAVDIAEIVEEEPDTVRQWLGQETGVCGAK